ncbi:MAG: hypothetical protein U0269_18410 [Polyangiales bacterium]
MKKYLLLLLLCVGCGQRVGVDADADAASISESGVATDALEPVAPFPLNTPFSFIQQDTQADLAAYGISTATVAPMPAGLFTVRPSEPGCVEIAQNAAQSGGDHIYEPFANRVDLQLGNEDVVTFDATDRVPANFGIATDAAAPPNTALRVIAYSPRWTQPWTTQQAAPPPVSLTTPSTAPSHWNRSETFTVEWDIASAPPDAVVEIEWLLVRGDYRRTLRCSAATSAGALRVSLWEHPQWFMDIRSYPTQGYMIFTTRRRIERGPTGESVVVESRTLVQSSDVGFRFD